MSNPTLPPEPSPQPARPLRLTIGLLLLWTTTTAMALGLAADLQRRSDEVIAASPFPGGMSRVFWALEMLSFLATPAYGAALAATVIAAYRAAIRLGGFPTQPGHWIAILLGIATLGFFAGQISNFDEHAQGLISTAVTILLAIVSCLAASATQQPRRWRAALVVSAGGFCSLLAMMIAGQAARLDATMPAMWLLYGLPGLAIGVAVLLAVAAAVIDLVRPPRYDLFHWVGTITLVVLVTFQVISLGLLYWSL
jgi:hypothetical protein